MIITKTPLRISLFGGGTDFSAYYRAARDGGAVIGFALSHYVYITARPLPPFFDHRYRCVWSEIELAMRPEHLLNPVYRAALSAHWDDALGGLELHYDSDLPARSGLGSSSSFATGLILALLALREPLWINFRTMHGGRETVLADYAIELERELLGEPGGHQDQIFAAFGGFNRIDFGGRFEDGWHVTNLGDPAALLRHCLLFYTGQQRTAAQLEGLKAERMEQNRDDLDDIRRSVDVAQEMIAAGDFASLGELLDANWSLKKCLAPGVSYPELDRYYSLAREAGAWGGKLLGAGGGGFLLLMASPERHEAIRRALSGLLEVPVGWSPRGATVYKLDDA